MGRIKRAGLEGSQIGEALSKMAVPKGQLSSSIAFIQAIPKRVKIVGEIAVKRNLAVEYEILAKAENAKY